MKGFDLSKIIHFCKLTSREITPGSQLKVWKLMLVFFAVLLLIFLTVDGYFLLNFLQETEGSSVEMDSGALLKIDTKSLKTVLQAIADKEAKFKTNLTAPIKVKDPSVQSGTAVSIKLGSDELGI